MGAGLCVCQIVCLFVCSCLWVRPVCLFDCLCICLSVCLSDCLCEFVCVVCVFVSLFVLIRKLLRVNAHLYTYALHLHPSLFTCIHSLYSYPFPSPKERKEKRPSQRRAREALDRCHVGATQCHTVAWPECHQRGCQLRQSTLRCLFSYYFTRRMVI